MSAATPPKSRIRALPNIPSTADATQNRTEPEKALPSVVHLRETDSLSQRVPRLPIEDSRTSLPPKKPPPRAPDRPPTVTSGNSDINSELDSTYKIELNPQMNSARSSSDESITLEQFILENSYIASQTTSTPETKAPKTTPITKDIKRSPKSVEKTLTRRGGLSKILRPNSTPPQKELRPTPTPTPGITELIAEFELNISELDVTLESLLDLPTAVEPSTPEGSLSLGLPNSISPSPLKSSVHTQIMSARPSPKKLDNSSPKSFKHVGTPNAAGDDLAAISARKCEREATTDQSDFRGKKDND